MEIGGGAGADRRGRAPQIWHCQEEVVLVPVVALTNRWVMLLTGVATSAIILGLLFKKTSKMYFTNSRLINLRIWINVEKVLGSNVLSLVVGGVVMVGVVSVVRVDVMVWVVGVVGFGRDSQGG